MAIKPKRVAVVTGGNRGIGYEVVRGLCKEFKDDGGVVYLTARDETRGKAAVEELEKEGCFPRFRQIDVKQISDVQDFKYELYKEHKGIDILVNTAGLKFDETAGTTHHLAGETLDVNFFCMLHVTSMLYHAFRPHSRVVNIACPASNLSAIPSQAIRDRLTDPKLSTRRIMILMNDYLKAVEDDKYLKDGWPSTSYELSKIGVVKMTEIQQKVFDNRKYCSIEDLVINCVNPGFVKTRMNNFEGTVSPEEAAKPIIKLALLPPNITSPRGKFLWHDMRIVDWINNSFHTV